MSEEAGAARALLWVHHLKLIWTVLGRQEAALMDPGAFTRGKMPRVEKDLQARG